MTRTPSAYLILAAATMVGAVTGNAHWSLSVIGLIGAIVLPGMALGHALGVRRDGHGTDPLLGIGLGLVIHMLLGAIESTVLPLVGVDRPFDRTPQLWILGILLLAGAAYELTSRHRIITITRPQLNPLTMLALCGMPIVTAIGATRASKGNGADLSLIGIGTCTGVALLLAFWSMTRRGYQRPGLVIFGIYTSILGVLWGTSLRNQHVFGWDIQKELAVAKQTALAGRWVRDAGGDAYNAMLSITALPARLSSLSGLPLADILRIFYPMVLALLPVVVYRTLRRLGYARSAGIVAITMIGVSRAYPRQLPAIARQEIALYLFVLGIAYLVAVRPDLRTRKLVVGILFAALSFTHYTSAYVTGALILFAWVATRLRKTQRQRNRTTAVLSLPVVLAVTLSAVTWNLVISPSASAIDAPAQGASIYGTEFLANREGANLLERWLGGSGVRLGTADEYARNLRQDAATRLEWMDPDRLLFTEVIDSSAPVEKGLLGGKNLFAGAYALAHQLILLTVVLSILSLFWRHLGRLRRQRATEAGGNEGTDQARMLDSDPTAQDPPTTHASDDDHQALAATTLGAPRHHHAEIVSLMLGMLIFSAIMRVSNWAGNFYNPERASLYSALVTAIAVAASAEWLLRRKLSRPGALGLAAVLLLGSWGTAPMIFGGNPPASIADTGEEVERFAYTQSEIATAEWLEQNLGPETFVQTDRYGEVILLNVEPTRQFGVVAIMHPQFIDKYAYVFTTRTNTELGRARGLRRLVLAVFESPMGPLEDNRPIVYSTDHTRIFG